MFFVVNILQLKALQDTNESLYSNKTRLFLLSSQLVDEVIQAEIMASVKSEHKISTILWK